MTHIDIEQFFHITSQSKRRIPKELILQWDQRYGFTLDLEDEENEKYIEAIAEKIHEYNLETVAMILIGSFRPLYYISAQMSRFFILPILDVFGGIGIETERFLDFMEKRDNPEKLMRRLEDIVKRENEQDND